MITGGINKWPLLRIIFLADYLERLLVCCVLDHIAVCDFYSIVADLIMETQPVSLKY